MTGREILLRALRNEPTPRPGWIPFVGVHGGKLIGVSATEYLKSSERIVQGLTRAYELYQPDGLPLVFDLHHFGHGHGSSIAPSVFEIAPVGDA